MKKFKSLLLILCVLSMILISIAVSCTPKSPATEPPATTKPNTPAQTPAEPEVLKIGMVTSLTGPISAAFKSLYDAVEPTEALYNNKGGITVGGQNYLIDIVTEDDQSSPAGAVSATNKIIEDGIKFMISSIYPPALMATTPVTNEAKVLAFTPSQANPTAYTLEANYSYNCYSNIYDIIPFYKYVKETNPDIRRIALLCPDDPGAAFIVENVIKKELPELGFEIVLDEKYPNTTEDFYPILPKVLASKPDAIELAVGITPWVASITNVSRELGFTGPIYGSACIGDMNLAKVMIKPEYCYDVYSTSIDPLSDKLPVEVQDLRKLVEQSGQQFIFDSFQPLAALSVALQGIIKAQSLDIEKVAAALENMPIETPNGGTATWHGSEYGDFQHLLVSDKIPISSISEDGTVKFEYIQR